MAMSFEFISSCLPREPKRLPKYPRLPETKEEKELLERDIRLYNQYCEELEKRHKKDE